MEAALAASRQMRTRTLLLPRCLAQLPERMSFAVIARSLRPQAPFVKISEAGASPRAETLRPVVTAEQG